MSKEQSITTTLSLRYGCNPHRIPASIGLPTIFILSAEIPRGSAAGMKGYRLARLCRNLTERRYLGALHRGSSLLFYSDVSYHMLYKQY